MCDDIAVPGFKDSEHQLILEAQLMWDEVAEWLRRWTANPLCSARMGSNPILIDLFADNCFVSLFMMFQDCVTYSN